MRKFQALFAALLFVLGSSGFAAAGMPVSETFYIDEEFVDTELCADFGVTTQISGHFRSSQYFDRDGNLVMEINNIALRVSYTANGITVNAVDTGVDLLSFKADGSFTVAITGNVQLLTAGGQGVVGGGAGRVLLGISPTGDVTVISDRGKHGGDGAAAICGLLAG